MEDTTKSAKHKYQENLPESEKALLIQEMTAEFTEDN
jgi:hypothetical protein